MNTNFLYNLWIVLMAIVAFSALEGSVCFWKQTDRLWRFIALILSGIFIEASISAILFGTDAHCDSINGSRIAGKIIIRIFQILTVGALKLYLYGYFQRPVKSDSNPAVDGSKLQPEG